VGARLPAKEMPVNMNVKTAIVVRKIFRVFRPFIKDILS
jgi:hypothetical protein